ncbi:unnamed protein product [Bemisia tabaci]|uniref:Uncharacterized protein n=1 Tax=Bemisia tabaci TaxID=7038 RepID=A0A9P0A8F0_BEMTA|nr:unnamed protein product [Bemisia tabaci]
MSKGVVFAETFVETHPISQFLVLLFTMFLVITSVYGKTSDYDKEQLAPIILVHGVSSSQIMGRYHTHGHPKRCEEKSVGKDGWEHFWFNIDMAAWGKHVLKCWAYRFKLLYDRNTHKCRNQNGVETRPKGKLGSLKCCEYLTQSPASKTLSLSKYFHQLADRLRHKGYSTDLSLKAHCYDWRYAPPQLDEQGYYNSLTELVEKVATDTQRKVALVAHSMGGLTTAYFLLNKTQDWKDKYIHAFVTGGTPWLGSIWSLAGYIVGQNYKVPSVDKNVMKKLTATFQSIAFLLPEEETYKNTVVVEWIPMNKTYTANQYQEFFADVGFGDAYLMRQDVRHLFPVPLDKLGVRYHCVWSNVSKAATAEKFRVHEKKMNDANDYEIVYGDGDKTVNAKSLRYCEKFQGNHSKITVKYLPGYTHKKLIQHTDFFNEVMTVVAQAQNVK